MDKENGKIFKEADSQANRWDNALGQMRLKK